MLLRNFLINCLKITARTLLPDVTENWPQMSEIERDQLTSMNNFFCGLHYLVGLADKLSKY